MKCQKKEISKTKKKKNANKKFSQVKSIRTQSMSVSDDVRIQLMSEPDNVRIQLISESDIIKK